MENVLVAAAERILVLWNHVRTEREAVGERLAANGQHAEVVVERVVFHHQDHDVIKRQVRIGLTGWARRVG